GQVPDALSTDEALARTDSFWREWSGRCTYQGRWRDAVVRSLITLKGLTFAPTGAIVAAPTTSLPEAVGGVRNWDYRYCWLRDASFTLDALMIGGYIEETSAFRDWLLRTVAGDPANMQIMYSLTGARRLTEYEVGWLPGYEDSRPVRVGNAASRQFQLDVYGEVLSCLYAGRKRGLATHDEGWRAIRAYKVRSRRSSVLSSVTASTCVTPRNTVLTDCRAPRAPSWRAASGWPTTTPSP